MAREKELKDMFLDTLKDIYFAEKSPGLLAGRELIRGKPMLKRPGLRLSCRSKHHIVGHEDGS